MKLWTLHGAAAALALAVLWAAPAQAGQVEAWVYPAFYPQSPVEHTYVKAIQGSGQELRCKCLGGDQGGDPLPGSGASGPNLPLERIHFMCSRFPCRWPKFLYATVGVCHQLANRGLESAGTTVSKAKGYGLSFFFFGPYGKVSLATLVYAMFLCRRAAPPAPESKALDKQVALFRDFSAKARRLPPGTPDEEILRLHRDYRRDSLNERIKNTLPGMADQKFNMIIGLWQAIQRRQDVLLAEHLGNMLASKRIPAAYIRKMDELAQKVQLTLRRGLSKEQYERFLNLPYYRGMENLVTWRDFIDPKGPVHFPESEP
jgi:hypothetical protein